MPRTFLSRKADTRRDLIAEIQQRRKEKCITLDDLGQRYRITAPAVSYRIKHMTMTYDQLVDLMELLEFPPDRIVWYMSGGRYKISEGKLR